MSKSQDQARLNANKRRSGGARTRPPPCVGNEVVSMPAVSRLLSCLYSLHDDVEDISNPFPSPSVQDRVPLRLGLAAAVVDAVALTPSSSPLQPSPAFGLTDFISPSLLEEVLAVSSHPAFAAVSPHELSYSRQIGQVAVACAVTAVRWKLLDRHFEKVLSTHISPPANNPIARTQALFWEEVTRLRNEISRALRNCSIANRQLSIVRMYMLKNYESDHLKESLSTASSSSSNSSSSTNNNNSLNPKIAAARYPSRSFLLEHRVNEHQHSSSSSLFERPFLLHTWTISRMAPSTEHANPRLSPRVLFSTRLTDEHPSSSTVAEGSGSLQTILTALHTIASVGASDVNAVGRRRPMRRRSSRDEEEVHDIDASSSDDLD
eukprot:GDKJ01034638.1.p1 GENE.GDKJ01034638.1~~GDKJ01034638.1.p1  ORF type:complete len:404 (-),score=118.94 GDKJ01034638.1:44-1177(-)